MWFRRGWRLTLYIRRFHVPPPPRPLQDRRVARRDCPVSFGANAISTAPPAFASGGLTQLNAPTLDAIKVSKCYVNSAGQMLIKAASADASARLFAYRPDGTLIGAVQNGGGSRYGGTVMPWQTYDPVSVTIRSSSGASLTVLTTPFQI